MSGEPASVRSPAEFLLLPEWRAQVGSFLEAISDGVTVQNAAGALVYVNSIAAHLSGFESPEAMLAAEPREILASFELLEADGTRLSPDHLPGRQVLQGLEPSKRLVRFRSRSVQREQWAWIAARPIRDSEGKIILVLNTFSEATEVVETERRLKASEQTYRVLAEVLPSQVWTARPDGALDYVNQRVLDYFGRGFDEMLGSGWLAVVHPDDVAVCLERWSHSLTTGNNYEVEFRLRRASDGMFRWHMGRAEAIRKPDGEISRWVGTNTDIDDPKRAAEERVAEQALAEEVLRENERRLRLALDAGRMGTWEWDMVSGRIKWSEMLERIHGIPCGSFPGTYDAYQQDMHPEDRERVLAAAATAVAERRDHSVLYRIIRPDGAVRWVEAFGRLSFDKQDRPVRLGGVTRDVTERVTADDARTSLAAEQAARAEAEQARMRTQQILEGITDSFAVYDHEWHVLFANEATTRQFVVPPNEVAGKTLWELLPDAVGTPIYDQLQSAMAGGVPTTIEDYYPPLDLWVDLRAYPLDSVGLAVYARDITPQKRAEQLRARLFRYADLRAEVTSAFTLAQDLAQTLQACCEAIVRQLEVSFARVWLVDARGEWLELLASAGRYTHLDGPHRRVRMGEFKVGLIAAERRPHVTNDVVGDARVSNKEWAKSEGMVAFAGYPLIAGDALLGVVATFATSAFPEDTLNGLGGIADAIAQGIFRRRAELELQERARELARSNADLEQFAYVASHDLQEPLRMVTSYNQLLARRYQGKLGQEADEFIAFSVEGVTRMQRVISDLLAYSRVGTRGKEFQLVSMQKVFDTAKENLKHAIAEENAVLTHDELPSVVGDEGQLVQLLQNLLGNAIKFHGENAPRAHFGVRKEEGAWTFFVEDNGVGIEPQYFERIFIIFQRLHSREQYLGTGIGLAICKKVVERHGGRIWVTSTPRAGTTFFFTIPISPSKLRRSIE